MKCTKCGKEYSAKNPKIDCSCNAPIVANVKGSAAGKGGMATGKKK